MVGDEGGAEEGWLEGEGQRLPIPTEDGASGDQRAQRVERDDKHGSGLDTGE